MVDREVLALEDSVLTALALFDLNEHRLDAVLATFGGHQGQGEPRTDDWNVPALFEQEGDRADVVFVGVGEHQRLDVRKAALEVAHVRQDQVHSGLVVGGEHDPAIDDQQPAEVFEHRHIAADLADPTQRGDPQAAWGQRTRRHEFLVHLEIILQPRAAPRPRACRRRAPRSVPPSPRPEAAGGHPPRYRVVAVRPWTWSLHPVGSMPRTAVPGRR